MKYNKENNNMDKVTISGEITASCWNFKRTSNITGEYGFTLAQRTPEGNLSDYRILGQSKNIAASQNTKTRPNRYNSSVKMVASDGPAPWDNFNQISYVKLPVVGEVAAGQYDVTIAYHETGYGADVDFVMLNQDEVKINRQTYALRVRGQSMIENEIDDGDIIIVQSQTWADEGDFVIACLTDSNDPAGLVTLKRFYRHRYSDRVLLQPANQNLGPIHILPQRGDSERDDLDGVKIQGRVVAIIKNGWVN
ncbi:S24 family peptidase [Candidatus Chlorohelix sp.]|uniref:LexA family protein n=1 Tax=Candidatus Chlorohelix sp. TaxID=3139201 RepID=UPI00306E9597